MKRSPSIRSISVAIAVASTALATGAQASPVANLLTRNAAQQAQIRSALAAEKMDPLRAAQVEERAADVYRQQAEVLANADLNSEQQAQLRQAQRDLAGAIAWAEKHPAQHHGTAMDRTHLQVASTRNAEQQWMIARKFASDQLAAAQVAALESAQARIVADQSAAAMNGHETVDAAREIQHAQDLQDYAIREDPGVLS